MQSKETANHGFFNEYYSQALPSGEIPGYLDKNNTRFTRFEHLQKEMEEKVKGNIAPSPMGKPSPGNEMFPLPSRTPLDRNKGIGPRPGCNFLDSKPPPLNRLNPPNVPRPEGKFPSQGKTLTIKYRS